MDPWNESYLKQELADFGRLLYERGLIGVADGNLSVRLDDHHLLVTPSGVPKAFMRPEQMVKTDLAGRPVSGAGRPSSEILMHCAVFEERPDVRAVVHAHPPHATAFSIAGLGLTRCIIPEIVVTLGTVPTARYATPGTDELPNSVRETIRGSDALVLERHGALTVGSTLMQAFVRMDTVEHTAKITYLARSLGHVEVLQPDEVGRLLATRKTLGIQGKNTICDDCGARQSCSNPLYP
ncbi:MAG: class II aldolase/adducin family protein [Planctomycetota bacterium]